MGGAQTLYIATANLDKFAYIGVYSSGLIGILRGGGRGPGAAPAATSEAPALNPDFAFDTEYKTQLDNPAMKKGVKLFWFSTGSQDGLITTTKATIELYKKHGFNPVFHESPGGHTWINWRNYLNEFAPQLFQ